MRIVTRRRRFLLILRMSRRRGEDRDICSGHVVLETTLFVTMLFPKISKKESKAKLPC